MSKEPSKTLTVYKTRPFARFARKAHISEKELRQAARLANDGLVDADLGGGVIKQRIARQGEGKSGGSRSILLFKRNERAVFVFGFEKKNVSNIDRRELEAFRELADVILGYTPAEMAKQVEAGALILIGTVEEETYAEETTQ